MKRLALSACAAISFFLFFAPVCNAQGYRYGNSMPHEQEIKQAVKRQIQDKVGALPPEVLEKQIIEAVQVPQIEQAIESALAAADGAFNALKSDNTFHKGKTITVPDDFPAIQKAIDAAKSGDIVVVKAGTYYEQITIKDGVKLVSDSSGKGDELAPVEDARTKLPKRTLRTIIDGSKAKPSELGMVNFALGLGRNTIVDGFTIQNMPKQDHHQPGHAHAVNLRGASPVIENCYVLNNGSTGIGSHVAYRNSEKKISDFRQANILYKSQPVIYRNIVAGNFGLGIGCNHFSEAVVLGNEAFKNDDSEVSQTPSPGIGIKHGAAPTIVGNIVHDNIGGGILTQPGEPQGKSGVDRPTHPTVENNVVFASGDVHPGISAGGAGSATAPVRILGNFVYNGGTAGIGVAEKAYAILENNVITGTTGPGISINGATAIKINGNRVKNSSSPGFLFIDANVLEMTGNAADLTDGPRFVSERSIIKIPGSK